ncbi:hypothetical protein BDW42DRAFT_166928 [Aspergillus taichungensis]|uniref:Uncharacterized protein n=1 Tax=Aspergillus taichungensis TaxID=482145 RepID=A0A2J5HXT4_9EURO|nr:hypothetical protein BDW42DRAFT_166928 [Aspergillus taichungensis]
MISISLPSLSNLIPWRDRTPFSIPPVQTHEIDTAQERPARAVKHMLKLNHTNYSLLRSDGAHRNQMPHVLSAYFLLGADANALDRAWDAESKALEPWVDSPAEISTYDWKDFLGRREYQRAFLDFFEDQLVVNYAYDWRKLVSDYLFTGQEPLYNALCSELGHTALHLSTAFVLSSREVAMETLALAATTLTSKSHASIPKPAHPQQATYRSTSFQEILTAAHKDKRFSTTTTNNEDTESILLDHYHAWTLDPQNADAQLREALEVAASLAASSPSPSSSPDIPSILNILATAHAGRVLIPLIPGRFHEPLLRQWWLLTLRVYVAQGRPELLSRASVQEEEHDLEGRNWEWVAAQCVGAPRVDALSAQSVLALREAAGTWGDPEGFYLRAAVRLVEGLAA